MAYRSSMMALLLAGSSCAFADLDYTSDSPDFELHREKLAEYVDYGRALQGCATFAQGAGFAITLPQVEEYIEDGAVDMEPFIASVRASLAPPDPFMNALFSTIYWVASTPTFVEKYRLYQEKYDTDAERRTVSWEKFMANCETRKTREEVRDLIILGYDRATKL